MFTPIFIDISTSRRFEIAKESTEEERVTQRLQYRLYCDEDLPGLRRLWQEETRWGDITPEVWRQWYVDTPHGPCLVVVAEDESGEIAGQEVFTPSCAVVGDREVRALRLSAPILRKELRRESLRRVDHPVIGLYMAAAEAASAQGFHAVYALPEYGWLPFFRWAPRFGLPRFADAEYNCVSLPVSSALTFDGTIETDDLTARAVTEFGEEYDELWLSAKESFPINCGVVRRRDWLRFRNEGRIAVEVRDKRDGSLVGYTATKKQTGLLADALARRPADLTKVLASTLKWLATERGRLAPQELTHLKVMETPALRPALQALGFVVTDYKFAFTCSTFDSTLKPEAIAPERWYIMPGD